MFRCAKPFGQALRPEPANPNPGRFCPQSPPSADGLPASQCGQNLPALWPRPFALRTPHGLLLHSKKKADSTFSWLNGCWVRPCAEGEALRTFKRDLRFS